MNKTLVKSAIAIIFFILITTALACSKKEETAKESPQQPQQTMQTESPLGLDNALITPSGPDSKQLQPKDFAVSVDGIALRKDDLSKIVKAKMNLLKDKISANKKKEAQEGIKKQVMEEFVFRTLLRNEAESKKIVATDKEVQSAINQIKENIPPEKKVEDFFKENNIRRDDIALGVKIRKLVEMESGKKTKPTQKEISKFYTDNKDKFTNQESVHVRHILVTIDEKDDEKTKAEKKAKIESLRKQIVEGADFAEIAKNNSDCPSKENGGDLGEIKKGQTVKPFEDAAFSQEINKIGPVVTTEFGHHIIQVLGRSSAQSVKLEDVKDKIAMYLEQQKQTEAFSKLTARLKKNAVITFYEH